MIFHTLLVIKCTLSDDKRMPFGIIDECRGYTIFHAMDDNNGISIVYLYLEHTLTTQYFKSHANVAVPCCRAYPYMSSPNWRGKETGSWSVLIKISRKHLYEHKG